MIELIKIQAELKAPKNQYNNFGKYHYRNTEGILEAIKPLLYKYGCLLSLNDEIIEVAGRIYVKAIARLKCGDEWLSSVAFAREEETKKGMDAAQITGAASSYARKYALNALFLIDDTKDPDDTNTHGKDKDSIKKLAKGAAIAKLEQCKTLDEIKGLWPQINDSDKDDLKALFIEKKNELSTKK